MLDIEFIKQNKVQVAQDMESRGVPSSFLIDALKAEEAYKKAKQELDDINSQKKQSG